MNETKTARPPYNHPSNRPADNLDRCFTYHAPQTDQAERYRRINDALRDAAAVVAELTPACADQSASLRSLREARMWANSAIALEEREP